MAALDIFPHGSIKSVFSSKEISRKESLKLQFFASFSSEYIFITSRFHVVALRLPGHSRSPWPSLLHCHFLGIFFPSFNAVFAFPQERAIFTKERASGMYTLSSYFTARVTGDLPMELILPTLFLSIAYWMTGLKPELSAFAFTLLVVLGYALISQGLGLALGTLIMDVKQASTVVNVTMLSFVLTGGYYVLKVPSFMSWIMYISTALYSYRLLISVQYGDGEGISTYLGCLSGRQDRATCKYIDEYIRDQIHPEMRASILMMMFVGYRLLAYIALIRLRA